MTNAEILANAKVGAIIGNKQILSALKKKGLIYDYSPWGYLEGCWVGYVEEDGYKYRNLYETFPKGNAPKETNEVIFKNEEEFHNAEIGWDITYMGCKFSTKYLDGCFKPYLQLVEKDGNREKEVNPRMCAWGAIV